MDNKKCKSCNEVLFKDEFYKTGTNKLFLSSNCKKCSVKINKENRINIKNGSRTKKKQNKFIGFGKSDSAEYNRNTTLFSRYGITPQQRIELFDSQDGKCYICEKHEKLFNKSLSVDHNHITGQVRGLLCSLCNQAIGLLKEDTKSLQMAINYLNFYNKAL